MVIDYQNLVTSEHQKPNFLQFIATHIAPYVDLMAVALSFINLFDIDLAVGDQLDILGELLGWTRLAPIYDGSVEATVLWVKEALRTPMSDSDYRIFLKAVILLNQWDGTTQGMYNIWNALGVDPIIIQDNQDMTISILFGGDLTGLIPFFLYNLSPRPAGVGINFYVPSVSGNPIFGFDIENTTISGFDVGYWVKQVLK